MVAQGNLPLAAYARSSDPQESWDAARSIPPSRVSETQDRVLAILRIYGPLTGEKVVKKFRETYESGVTDQRIRTALSDLKKKELVSRHFADGVSSTGLKASQWVAA